MRAFALFVVWVALPAPLAADDSVTVGIETLGLDVRLGYGGSLRSDDGGSSSGSGFFPSTTSYTTRSTLHAGRTELELRWIPDTMGLRIIAGVDVGALVVRHIEVESEFLELVGDRSRTTLGRLRATRFELGVGPVWRQRLGLAWGIVAHVNVMRVQSEMGDPIRETSFAVGLALSMGQHATKVGLGLHIGTTLGGELVVGWRLTLGFGAVRRVEHRVYDE